MSPGVTDRSEESPKEAIKKMTVKPLKRHDDMPQLARVTPYARTATVPGKFLAPHRVRFYHSYWCRSYIWNKPCAKVSRRWSSPALRSIAAFPAREKPGSNDFVEGCFAVVESKGPRVLPRSSVVFGVWAEISCQWETSWNTLAEREWMAVVCLTKTG